MILIFCNSVFVLIGAFAHILGWEFAEIYLLAGIIFFFASWIIVLNDMLISKVSKRSTWIKYMIIFPNLAQLLYLVRRNKLN